MPEKFDKGESVFRFQHGLHYGSRDGSVVYRLDGGPFPPIKRPERDVLKALLSYALGKLMDADEAEAAGVVNAKPAEPERSRW